MQLTNSYGENLQQNIFSIPVKIKTIISLECMDWVAMATSASSYFDESAFFRSILFLLFCINLTYFVSKICLEQLACDKPCILEVNSFNFILKFVNSNLLIKSYRPYQYSNLMTILLWKVYNLLMMKSVMNVVSLRETHLLRLIWHIYSVILFKT